jgi:hypothetical protein
VELHAWQDKKRVTLFLTYHKDEMGFKVNKANREETNPAVVCDYNLNMGAVDLRDKMLQPYLLKQSKGYKWYMKLFEGLLNVAIHNTDIICHSMPNNNGTDPDIQTSSRTRSCREAHVCWPLHCIWSLFN